MVSLISNTYHQVKDHVANNWKGYVCLLAAAGLAAIYFYTPPDTMPVRLRTAVSLQEVELPTIKNSALRALKAYINQSGS
jgi:hypothetical protein